MLCAVSAYYSLRAQPQTGGAAATAQAQPDGPPPGPLDYGRWLLLSAIGSLMLLTVTNHITHDIASAPFLWILPLTLYLLTFILCFEGRGWYRRAIFLGPLLVIVAAMAWALHRENGIMDIKQAIPLNLVGLFVMCMFFHGELADSKPAPRYLTRFYLMVSLGGALGGLAVGLVAAKVFSSYYEFGLGLVATLLIAAYVTRLMHPVVPLMVLVVVGFSGFHVYKFTRLLTRDAIVLERNFYGTLRVKDVDAGQPGAMRTLVHGVIMHGEQYLSPEKRNQPTSYYGETSGVGRALKALGAASRELRVGVVGLGTGTIAAYGRKGDVYRYYEINPQVVEIARRDFSFLGDSGAKVETVLGDARLTMEREAPQRYDLLAIDAFSSDSIPVHLITREAMAVYLRHMKPDGVIAFHITNRFLRLGPVVKRIADEMGLQVTMVEDDAKDSDLSSTDWVLVTRSKTLFENPDIAEYTSDVEDIPGLPVWTDDFNNLYQILK